MYKYIVTLIQKDENNFLVNKKSYEGIVFCEESNDGTVSPYLVNKRNREAVRMAIAEHLSSIGLYEGDSLLVEEVKRIK